jgi:hypothetical protein
LTRGDRELYERDSVEGRFKEIYTFSLLLAQAIARLQAGVKVADLRSLDAEKVRADSEKLVALLEMAAPKIGLRRPTLEEGAN